MLKIWGNEPRERARGEQTTCGHLASPCGRPWAPREREPSAPVGPMRPPRGADVAPRDLLGNLLLFPPFNQTSFPPSLMQFFEEHLNPASVFQHFLFTCFDHISLIRTRNHSIQKPKLLVSKRATNPKHFQRQLTSAFFSVGQFPVRGQYWFFNFLFFNFIFDQLLILSI